jgi:hypothetical protein
MNTLPRAVTAQILTDPNLYDRICQCWSEFVCPPRKHELTAAHYLLYAALRGKDWRIGFTCISNQRKLDNGAFQGWALFRAVAMIHMPSHEEVLLAPFGGLVTRLMVQSIRELIPMQNAYTYRPEQFTGGSFPFEAYSLPDSFQASTTARSADV